MLEEQGIGRPSTYAPTISTILDRHYVEKDGGKFVPTTLGKTICDLLVNYFSDILDVTFTSTLEESLDNVAKGTRSWVPMLKSFYKTFDKNIKRAFDEMPRVRIEEETDEHCEKCEKPMVIKTGRFGRFLACTGFPECRNTKQVLKNTGVACPECGGDIVERRSRARKRLFYGCSHFPTCNFLTNQKPLPDPCPECGGLLTTARRNLVECIKCRWSGSMDSNEPALQGA
jgi:DNA topoisomerase-1